MRVRCVTFDIDDTLYLERDYVLSGFQAVAAVVRRQFGVSEFAEACDWLFGSGRRGSIFDEALVLLGLDPNPRLISELVRTYRRHEPEISLFADAQGALEWSAAIAAVAVVSDGHLDSQRAKARRLGLERFASPIVLTAEWGSSYAKPARRAFQMVELEHRARGPECVYMADNPAKDFAAPRALGWGTVRVRRRGALHEGEPSGDDVDIEIASLERLETVLATL